MRGVRAVGLLVCVMIAHVALHPGHACADESQGAHEPAFPSLPIYTAVAGAGMLLAGTTLVVSAADSEQVARRFSSRVRASEDALDDDVLASLSADVDRMNTIADERRFGGAVLLVGGAVSLTTAVLWYALFEPEGGWSWSLQGQQAWGVRVSREF